MPGVEPAMAVIAETAAELMGVAVGPDTDLFDAGATSITVIVMVGRARRVVGDALTPALVLRGRTPRQIACLAAERPTETRQAKPAGQAGSGDSRASRSPHWVTGLPITQYRMWYIEQRFPGAGDSAAPVLFRIRGRLQTESMKRAVRFVVQRHEALRTRLVSADGKYVDPQIDPVADIEALWAVQAVEPDALAAEVDAFCWRAFDLNRELPVRARLFLVDEIDHLLALSVHHTAYDGWSDGVLCRDLSAAYTAYASGAEPELPNAVGFHAAARMQTARAEAAGIDDEYWLEHLRGVPDIPLGEPPTASTGAVQETPVALDEVDAGLLRAACSRLATTPTAVYLAAWILALREETGASDFAIGMPLAGRTIPEAENVIGCFASSAILRFPASVGAGVDCVRHGAGLLERAMADQFLPLERMFFALRPEDTGRNPFCQIGFVLQNNEHDPLTLPDLEVERIRVPQRTSIYEMALVLWPGTDFGSHVWHRDDVVTRERAERLARSWPRHVARLCQEGIRASGPTDEGSSGER